MVDIPRAETVSPASMKSAHSTTLTHGSCGSHRGSTRSHRKRQRGSLTVCRMIDALHDGAKGKPAFHQTLAQLPAAPHCTPKHRRLHVLLLTAPPLLSIGVRHDPSATLQTHNPTPATFCRSDPAVPFTGHNVAGRNKLSIVTATTGTANLACFRTSHLIVIVRFPY